MQTWRPGLDSQSHVTKLGMVVCTCSPSPEQQRGITRAPRPASQRLCLNKQGEHHLKTATEVDLWPSHGHTQPNLVILTWEDQSHGWQLWLIPDFHMGAHRQVLVDESEEIGCGQGLWRNCPPHWEVEPCNVRVGWEELCPLIIYLAKGQRGWKPASGSALFRKCLDWWLIGCPIPDHCSFPGLHLMQRFSTVGRICLGGLIAHTLHIRHLHYDPSR